MEWGDWIAVFALAVAIASFLVERHARQTEVALLRRQVEHDAVGIELLRQQVQGEADERDDRRRARVAAEQGQVSGRERSDQFAFTVTNLGPSAIRDVDVKVRTIKNDDATPRISVATGMTAGERRDVDVEVPKTFSRRRDLVLWARWRDDLDDHEEALIPIRPIT